MHLMFLSILPQCHALPLAVDIHRILTMQKDISSSFPPEVGMEENALLRELAKRFHTSADSISGIRIRKRSIDARHNDVKVMIDARVYINEKPEDLYRKTIFPDTANAKSAIVVGFGPAGIFASLTLLEMGIKPIVLERGEDVHSRLKAIGKLSQSGILDEESNYAFGEGGAGAFSDGKLYTRSSKRGDVGRILSLLVQHGADESILYDARPHIGSDKLPYIIENIRNTIISHSGEVHFGKRVVSLLRKGDETAGVRCQDGSEYPGPVILATGHSAKDVYYFLHDEGYALEAKSTAAGVRLEHPQQLIDSIQYHREDRGKYLPPASYSFRAQVNGRGVYSFCMCPGGVVVPASSENGYLALNGMSPSSRGGRKANSGIIVELRKEELEASDPFAMLRFIESIERGCFIDGFGAHAERMTDFMQDKPSSIPPSTTYPRPVIPSRLDDYLPHIIAASLREGFRVFDRSTRGRFITESAMLLAPETRTSSPVRILRDSTMKQGRGLYPAGEGAGYAGGIVSAAIDGSEAALRLGGDYGIIS